MLAPSTSASPTTAAASSAVRCWRISPGLARPARIRSMRNGVPLTSESASDVRRIWPPPSPRDPSTVSIASSLHAHDLPQRVHDLHEVLLRLHDGVDGLVGSRRLIDDVGVLAAFHARRRLRVVVEAEPALGLRPGHRSPGPVAAAGEALRIAAAAHDVGARPHAAGDDAEIALARPHRALARHQHVDTVVVLT